MGPSALLLSVLFAVGCGGKDASQPIVDEPAAAATPAAPEEKSMDAPADVEAAPADATTTASGLAYKILSKGDGGDKPTKQSKVEVHYTGWTTDGKMFDSSHKRGTTTKFPLTGVIAGWTEGLQFMDKGASYRFWIPENLAYKGRPGKPAGMLVFDVDLISFTTPPPPPPAPDDVAAAPADAIVTASGLAYKVLKAGTGDNPIKESTVTVDYTGWHPNGESFDSSISRGKPASFPVGRVIPGWTEGMQLMNKGAKFRFWIPEDLAYGGRPGPPAGMLVFDVELLSFTTPPPPPATPSDVAAPPADATTTASGLAYKVLKQGDGTAKPGPTTRVKVHYTGWTTDGKSFDSSVTRGKPSSFPLNGVIGGWTEGLQLMSPGDEYRFWIPEAQAYGGRPGKPAGMLVFDVQLIEILN